MKQTILKFSRLYLLLCVSTFIFAGSYRINEHEAGLLQNEECKVCDYYSSCVDAVGKQRGGSSCDDNNGQCKLAGSLCRPTPDTEIKH